MNEQESKLANSVAIVTGISRGFGRAVSQLLLREGWVVVGDGRDGGAFARVPNRGSDNLHFIEGDINDEQHLHKMISTAESLGRLRLLVNNAGALGPSPLPPLADLSAGDFESLLRVNTVAPLRLIQLALPGMKVNDGVIVNISSDAAVESYPGWGGYGSTKAALERLTFVLAIESPSVRFYVLDPGDMRTDMHQAAFPGEDISDRPEPETSAPAILKLAARVLPSGRYRAKEITG
jgi:NAD(P)-dependent dehydrogenase (short-subunit alcohol dehydrogenase family)